MQVITYGLLCIPTLNKSKPGAIILLFISYIWLNTQLTPNQARGKIVAEKYATNAIGAVTGMGRICFAIGQGLSPVVMSAAYNQHTSLACAIFCGIQVSAYGPRFSLLRGHGCLNS